MGGEPEQTAHTVEEVGWFHHAWDEVGPQLVTGLCSIAVAYLVYLGVRYKNRNRKQP
jgi:hypothetical protein